MTCRTPTSINILWLSGIQLQINKQDPRQMSVKAQKSHHTNNKSSRCNEVSLSTQTCQNGMNFCLGNWHCPHHHALMSILMMDRVTGLLTYWL